MVAERHGGANAAVVEPGQGRLDRLADRALGVEPDAVAVFPGLVDHRFKLAVGHGFRSCCWRPR